MCLFACQLDVWAAARSRQRGEPARVPKRRCGPAHDDPAGEAQTGKVRPYSSHTHAHAHVRTHTHARTHTKCTRRNWTDGCFACNAVIPRLWPGSGMRELTVCGSKSCARTCRHHHTRRQKAAFKTANTLPFSSFPFLFAVHALSCWTTAHHARVRLLDRLPQR